MFSAFMTLRGLICSNCLRQSLLWIRKLKFRKQIVDGLGKPKAEPNGQLMTQDGTSIYQPTEIGCKEREGIVRVLRTGRKEDCKLG